MNCEIVFLVVFFMFFSLTDPFTLTNYFKFLFISCGILIIQSLIIQFINADSTETEESQIKLSSKSPRIQIQNNAKQNFIKQMQKLEIKYLRELTDNYKNKCIELEKELDDSRKFKKALKVYINS